VFVQLLILILDSRHAGDIQPADDRLRSSCQPQSITALWPVPDIYCFMIEAQGGIILARVVMLNGQEYYQIW